MNQGDAEAGAHAKQRLSQPYLPIVTSTRENQSLAGNTLQAEAESPIVTHSNEHA